MLPVGFNDTGTAGVIGSSTGAVNMGATVMGGLDAAIENNGL
jgi:hypothetical protein